MISKILVSLFALVFSASSGFVLPENIVINSPSKNDSIQGVVEIKGTVISDQFSSAEIYFGYANTDVKNWFLISRLDQPVENTLLARWDTTTITDGEYGLQLILNKKDGTTEKVTVSPLHVRNYSIEPTVITAPTSVTTTDTENQNPTQAVQVYATPFVENPASTSENGILQSMLIGISGCLLVLLGLLGYRIFGSRNRLN